jgi:hypothetical protein
VRIYQWDGTAWNKRGEDIDGEEDGDLSGHSVSLSADGTIVAIGAIYNDANEEESGHVRIYQWNETQWIQRGNDIDGETKRDLSGYSVSLSADGDIVAIGAIHNDANGEDSGHVRIYQWDGTEWIQLGSDIDGEALGDNSGQSVSLSSDGSIVAIGAPGYDVNGPGSGHVRIYRWNGAAWTQRGNDIDGEAAGDHSHRISLSADGTIVAIGSGQNNGNGEESGHVRIYQWNGTEWMQRGSDIDGEAAGDASTGVSLSLSADGNIVAIGAAHNDNRTGIDAGHVRIYQWNETEWIQRGNDIEGKVEADLGGSVISLSGDGGTVAISAEPGGNRSDYLSIYRWDATGQITGDPAHAELLDRISQQQSLVADLQAQVTNISLTQGPQGPQGKVGATGADADCVACADVANGAVDLACLVLGENIPTNYAQTQAAATVIVNTLLISTNICEPACDIGAEIDAAIDAKMNP